MKRNTLDICCIVFLMALAISLCGCESPFMSNHPSKQTNTTWSTSDRTVVFYIGDDLLYSGMMKIENEPVSVIVSMSTTSSLVDICYESDYEELGENDVFPSIETWKITKIYNDRFIVEVVRSMNFEIGQEIVFYRNSETH